MKEAEFAARLRGLGAEVYIVGGWVRDCLRGATPKDKDYMVCGCREEDFRQFFPSASKVGKSFPVYLMEIEGRSCEVAFARRERKAGTGYHGFQVAYGPEVTVEEDLYRRDTTMNSMALRLSDGAIIDPYGGRADLGARCIRAVSPHFCDDPVRALRAARQAAEFDFAIEEKTYGYMRACREEMGQEPQERFFEELKKALTTERPSIFFRALERAGLLKIIFPELAALIGKTQPVAFHPEGDAFQHTLVLVDKVAADTHSLAARFAGLAHDLGKGTTPEEMLPHHYGHEKRGLTVLQAWHSRMTLPREWMKAANFVIKEHMRAPRLEKPGKMARLLLDMPKSGLEVEDFKAVIRADHGSLPPYLEQAGALRELMSQVSGREAPEELEGMAVGAWIFSWQVRLLQQALKGLQRERTLCYTGACYTGDR